MYFVPPLKGFPWELSIGARGKKTRIMGLPGRERSLTISSAIWIQCTNVTDTWRQQRLRLRIVWQYVHLFRHSTGIAQTDGIGGTVLRYACMACWHAIEKHVAQDRIVLEPLV